ncbi:MAG: ABC transporter ATP-binding protein [Betaproteobacteria bacterium]
MRTRIGAGGAVSDAPLLCVDGLCVAYGNVEAVRDVSLAAARGSIVTVIGPNGAGKTTLLGALMGVLPSRGSIRYDGKPIGALSIEQRVAEGIVLVPEKRELFASMSVDDHLLLGAFTRRRDADIGRLREDVYARFPRLGERRAQLAATLSGGERQMLALGRGLMSRPRLLLLDEPSLGLAPRVVRDIFTIIAGLRDTGVTIVLVEQNARAALAVADFGYVLETGAMALSGDSRTLAADPRVAATYLGHATRVADGAVEKGLK